SLIYALSIQDKFIPYVSGGISKLWFSPKDEKGNLLPNNKRNLYDKNALSYDVEIGAKIPVTNVFSFEVGAGFHFLNTDAFDDLVRGTENDFYASSHLG